MAHVMGTANLLRQAEKCADQHCAGKPAPGCSGQYMPKNKKTADEGKTGRCMAGRKTTAGAAIAHAPGPMRHISCHTAKLLQIPGATAAAVNLDGRDNQQGYERCQRKLRPPCHGEFFQGAQWPENRHQQSQLKHPGPQAYVVMQQIPPQPVALQRETAGRAKPACHPEI